VQVEETKPGASENNTSSDSDDDEPLSVFAKKVRRRLIDDSKEKRTTHIENVELQTQESEQMTPTRIRDKAWKRKQTSIKLKSKKTIRRSLTDLMAKKLTTKINNLQMQRKRRGLKDILKVKLKTKRNETIKDMVKRLHDKRLNTLLLSNELERVAIYGDGNCFFSAVKISGDLEEGTITMRENVCELMKTNANSYMAFTEGNEATELRKDEFCKEVEKLKRNGEWNIDIADILPLAVANYLGCNVRIYSSALSTPVINIKPDIPSDRIISIAYTAVRGYEHYDATHRVDGKYSEQHDVSSKRSDQVKTNENISSTRTDTSNIEQQSTPHKRAVYKSPIKNPSSRKRKRNPANWKKNKRKILKTEGKEYISTTGKVMGAKSVRPHNCQKCKFKCAENFTEEERQEIFTLYYNLGSYERQRQYICEMVKRCSTVRKGQQKRSFSQKFNLPKGEQIVRVCRDFFSKTLDLKRKTIDYSTQQTQHGIFAGQDKRGKHTPTNKTDEEKINFVKEHINSFPKMESHYTRKASKKQYLPHDLNIKKMWILYCEKCKGLGHTPVKENVYRKVFCEHFNLSFFKPKKDQCSLCTLYERRKSGGNLSTAFIEQYKQHQLDKTQAREEKSLDKHRAQTDQSIYVATFDLQAVLTTPCSLVSELYYSRKLCCYNLTIYSLGDKNVFCHVWDETQGKRGSSEIATCLLKNTISASQTKIVKEIVYFSDTCGGQNRNKFVTASHLYALTQVPTLEKISHKFLVSGHSQMECDSVHSTIEGAKKITPVYVPSQWCTIIALARKTKPYVAIPMKFHHIIDFKQFVNSHCPNLKNTTNGHRVNWLKVKWIQVRKEKPRSVFVNYTFDPEAFMEVDTQKSHATRKKQKIDPWPQEDSDLTMCYQTKLPISETKKKDLLTLCNKEIIPEEFVNYFQALPVSTKQKDYVPVESGDDDTDNE